MRAVITFVDEIDLSLITRHGGEIIDDLKQIPKLVIADITEEAIDYISNYPEIQCVSKEVGSRRVRPMGLADVDPSTLSWQSQALKTSEYWKKGLSGKGVKVGVYGYGIGNEPRLNVVGGIDATNPTNPDYRRLDGTISEIWHETQCAYVLAGAMDTVSGVVYSGVAPDINLYSLKAYTETDYSTSNSIMVLNWAIENELDIISVSWNWDGSSYETDELKQADIQAWEAVINAGILVVCATYNDNYDLEADWVDYGGSYPYSIDGTISVTGLNTNYTRYPYAYGDKVDFIAPARSVHLFYNNISTSTFVGTSYGTAMIAGVFALYKQAFPSKTNDEIYTDIANNTRKIDGQVGWDRYRGWGLPQPSPSIMTYVLPQPTSNRMITERGRWTSAILDERGRRVFGNVTEYGGIVFGTPSIPPQTPTAPPTPTVVSVNRNKISDETGVNSATVTFKFDTDVTQWSVNVMGASSTTGTIADSGGAVSANTEITAVIEWNELYQEGQNKVNIYGLNTIGWTPYENEIIVRDSFSRSDGVLGESETGQFWSVTNGDILIEGGRAKGIYSGNNIAVVNSNASDCQISIDIYSSTSTTWIEFRRVSIDSRWWVEVSTSGRIRLSKFNGVRIDLFDKTVTYSIGETLKVNFNGGSIKVYYGGVLIGEVADTYNQNITYHGFGFWSPSGNDFVDNFIIEKPTV